MEVISNIRVNEVNLTDIEFYMKNYQKNFQCRGEANFEAYLYDDIILFIENVFMK